MCAGRIEWAEPMMFFFHEYIPSAFFFKRKYKERERERERFHLQTGIFNLESIKVSNERCKEQ